MADAEYQVPESYGSRPASGPIHRRAWKSLGIKEREELLRQRATKAELALLAALQSDPRTATKFKFQAHVKGFYADFLFRAEKLVVELDGAVHSEVGAKIADAKRTRRLVQAGYHVIRFWNGEVLKNAPWTVNKIVQVLEQRASGRGASSRVRAEAMASAAATPPIAAVSIDLNNLIVNTRQRPVSWRKAQQWP